MHKNEIYLHYGDARHTPMQTVRFHGTATELKKLVREAAADGWPLRVQVGPKHTHLHRRG